MVQEGRRNATQSELEAAKAQASTIVEQARTAAAALTEDGRRGAEDDYERLLRSWCAHLDDRGFAKLVVFTSPLSPGYPVLLGVGGAMLPFDLYLFGPETPEGLDGGFYVRPTLFADVDNGMRIAQEEIFGPVIVVIAYRDEQDAVRIANDSPYGLSGGVWTTNPEHGLEIARRIRTGVVRINSAPPSFDGPFGGYKASGIGRENGAVGLTEYIEHKTINT